jgi:hypothetical protein
MSCIVLRSATQTIAHAPEIRKITAAVAVIAGAVAVAVAILIMLFVTARSLLKAGRWREPVCKPDTKRTLVIKG